MNFEEIPFDRPEDLVAYLRPSPEIWGSIRRQGSTWIFRGESDASWDLVPSAWRKDANKFLDPVKAEIHPRVRARVEEYDRRSHSSTGGNLDRIIEHRVQVEAEVELVRAFADLADELGLQVPEFDSIHAPNFGWCSSMDRNPLPGGTLRVNVAFALAQHHGIPTRLLDWTRKPLIAAFFAADGVNRLLELGKGTKTLCVWALDNYQGPRLRPPRHGFQYLHAQAGLFTFSDNGDMQFLVNGQWPSLSDLTSPANYSLRKLLLPADQSDALLRLLWGEGISIAHLMPTYDRVSSAVLAALRWPR